MSDESAERMKRVDASIARQLSIAMAENARLRAALIDATATLVGAASAYRKHASRHKSVGRAQADPLFTTRAMDFDKAAERARAALAPRYT
jgi:hypothetical protein